ncbi:UDP-N-acetylmuramate--L-alanine ligase [bacterium]|nr:UDP-N-acetylmuramate--L-alanine ligase [bacterium]
MTTPAVFRHVRRIHMVGIGGAGMCGIAEVLNSMGFIVSGSDLVRSEATNRLESLGIRISFEHNAENAAGTDVVVFSTAVRPENAEVRFARENRIPTIPRSEMLAELMRLKSGIAVSGTHGKTTTTSMIGTILTHAGMEPTVIVGGKVRALGTGAALGKGGLLVAEADEFDRSFLKLSPNLAVITTIEAEHLDTYLDIESIKDAFVEFANKVPFYGVVIACIDDTHTREVLPRIKRPLITFGRSEDANYRICKESYLGMSAEFQLVTPESDFLPFGIRLPGRHNVLNATAAAVTSLESGVPFEKIQEGLLQFEGVHRRFEYKGEFEGALVFDDYAHHPTEVRVTLEAARQCWPERRIVAVFQPHLFSRTRDFANEFAESLSLADVVAVLEIYPARELPLPNVSTELVIAPLRSKGTRILEIEGHIDIVAQIRAALKPKDIVVIMGAGSVTHIADQIVLGLRS